MQETVTKKRLWLTTATTLMILAAAAGSWSAPMIPRGPRIGDEVRSLKDISAVQLAIMTPQRVLSGVSGKAKKIAENWTQKLASHGILVSDDSELPMLKLSMVTVQDEDAPDVTAYLLFLTLEQSIHLERLGGIALRIPTWTGLNVGVKPNEGLREGFRVTADKSLEQFLNRVRIASVPR